MEKAIKTSNFKPRKKYEHGIEGYLFALPSYTIYFLFVFLPVIVTIYFSFTNYDLNNTCRFVGLKNYFRLFKDPIFITSVKNTFTYAIFTILPQIAFGLVTAVMLNRKLIGQKFFRVCFYMPNVTAMAAISMVWLWIYDPTFGVVNSLAKTFGFPVQNWLFSTKYALFAIIAMSIWKAVGYNMIIYLSGLQQIPEELYEAARVDGASFVTQFFKITLPMLRPTTFFLIVTGTVQCFSVFEQVNILTSGGPMNSTTTIVHQIYLRAFTEFQMGYASSMAVFLLMIVLAITVLNFKYGSKGQDIEAA